MNLSERDIEAVLNALTPRLTEDDKNSLSAPFTEQEVKNAIFSIPLLNPLDVTGFQSSFIKDTGVS